MAGKSTDWPLEPHFVEREIALWKEAQHYCERPQRPRRLARKGQHEPEQNFPTVRCLQEHRHER
jgi:hypothetical protein